MTLLRALVLNGDYSSERAAGGSKTLSELFARPQILHRGDIEEIESKQIGEGEFAQVRLALLVSGSERKKVAIKRNTSRHFTAADDVKELHMFSAPPIHANVIRFLGILTSSSHIDFVMELAQGGNLLELLSDPAKAEALRKDTKRVIALLQGVLSALEHLHNYKFVHGDLAARMFVSEWQSDFVSGNVLLSSEDPVSQIAKLADWGMMHEQPSDIERVVTVSAEPSAAPASFARSRSCAYSIMVGVLFWLLSPDLEAMLACRRPNALPNLPSAARRICGHLRF